jgi:hypothetical protein
MSARRGSRLVGHRLWLVGLAGVVLAAVAAVPSGAVAASRSGVAGGSARAGRPPLGQTPDQVINAQTDPNAATQALSTGCADITNCSLAKLSNPNTPADPSAPQIINAYGPPSVLGDVLYNCANPEGPDAYTSVGVSDTRGETTSVSEKLSVTLQGGLIGIASTSLDAWVSSTQAQTFSTTVSTQTQVTVPPGYKGFTTTQVLSAETQASYYITRGIHLIEVTGIDLTFPGYQDNQNSGDSQVIYNTIATPINPLVPINPTVPLDNYQSIAPCNSVSDSPTTALGGARGKGKPAARGFKLTVCPPRGRCVTHTIRDMPPPRIRQATAILTRRGRTYATGTDIHGNIRLKERRKIRVGRYRLTIKQKPRKLIARQNGRRLHTAQQQVVINVPINVCGNTVGPVSGLNPAFGNSCQNAKA